MPFQLLPFSDSLLPAAAVLLAERNARLEAPAASTPEAARAAVEEAWQREGASGVRVGFNRCRGSALSVSRGRELPELFAH